MPGENNWITHDTAVPYENAWIRVEHNNVTTPGGSKGIYGVVRFKNVAVGVIPIDDEDHTWLVGQYRYATGQYSWEMPEGGAEPGESFEETARRELKEETGMTAASLTPLFSNVVLSNSVTDEAAYAFVATGLQAGDATPEDTEELAIRRLPVEEAIQLVLDGEINDAFSVMAFLTLDAVRRRQASG